MQVAESIHALRIPFTISTPMGPVERFVNVFIIYGQKLCLIDTGIAAAHSMIFDYIEGTGRKPDEISTVILTHSHPDHLGAAKTIKEATGCQVLAHAGEMAWIENVEQQFAERPVPGFHTLVAGSVTIDGILAEGAQINLDGRHNLKVIHTPGHSKGSISLWAESDQALIIGDAVPLVGDMPIYDDPMLAIESIRKLQTFREAKILLSAWDEPRRGDAINQVMEAGIHYIQRIHQTVLEQTRDNPQLEEIELAKNVFNLLNLPPFFTANPLALKSLSASLKNGQK